MIRKVGRKFRVLSPKAKRNMGEYTSLADAQRRERQIEFFVDAAKAAKAAKRANWNIPGAKKPTTQKRVRKKNR